VKGLRVIRSLSECATACKLAPVPSYFVDMLKRRTYTGEQFSPGWGAAERMIPLMGRTSLRRRVMKG